MPNPRVGNALEQTVKEEGLDGFRVLSVNKDGSEVPIQYIFEAMGKYIENLSTDDTENLVDLYALWMAPCDILIEEEDKKSLASFISGVLIGKFLANTNSSIETIYIEGELP